MTQNFNISNTSNKQIVAQCIFFGFKMVTTLMALNLLLPLFIESLLSGWQVMSKSVIGFSKIASEVAHEGPDRANRAGYDELLGFC